ncbi:ATP-binding protein [Nocardioides panacisoli]|uniref:OmpR/PhoB-type domain-containing protein n=1 Tax=Nocardioides panacisoli TaxID=627624 RepID=A0ABP7IFR7_9ACTN
MGALAVRVLGELTVDGADLSVVDRKTRTLLQLLALARGRSVRTDALAEALWGDVPPARPADQVAVLASRLRRLLGRERVLRGDGGYRLAADWLDLLELDAVVTEAERRSAAGEVSGAVGAARLGLALVRGPGPDVPSEAEWVTAELAAVNRLVRRARRIAATTLLAAGSWLEALELATADAVADPFDEEAVRTAMRAQAAGGRPALALAAYADLRARLSEGLGTDPASETEALHTALLRGELPAAAPTQVAAALVGRGSQLAHLDALVHRVAADHVPRAVRVSGEAGIGKTTLLSAWTAERRRHGDLVLHGRCGPLDRAAPLDVVLSALGDHVRGSSEAAALLGPEAALLGPLLGPVTGPASPRPTDPTLGPAVLYAALTAVLARIAADRCVVLVVDDAHLAGEALADWLRYLLRRQLPLLVVLGARPTEGPAFPTTDHVGIGPLDRDQVAEVVGVDRADDLFRRSGGHPLFLTELAAVPSGDLPASLVAAITTRCDQLGPAGDLVRTAAVLGGDLDVELLAGVLGRSALDALSDVEHAVRSGLLVDEAGRHRFRHDLVREALVTGTSPGRAQLLHREAGRTLAMRTSADPAAVAEHARLGGDLPLAAAALERAAVRAAERFDHATAEALLDEALRLAPDDETRVARARVRIRRGRYAEAEADALEATGAGAERWETAAWAAYFDRRFDDAIAYADDGALAAGEPTTRTGCLVAAGRVLHARGDLDRAAAALEEAVRIGSGEARLEAATWLGVLRAHRGHVDEALELLRAATRPGVSVEHTSATLHALLFTGHALASAGRPAEALACFGHYTDEVTRRDVPRFAGRGVNFTGWVLRNLGQAGAGIEAHHEALEAAHGDGIPEMAVAALEDLAEERVRADDPEAAAGLLDRARTALVGDLVFGWRLAMRLDLVDAEVRLRLEDPEGALRIADSLASSARARGVPRYDACARLVAHRARAALGERADRAGVRADLDAVERAVGIEAWWWAGRTGADLGDVRLLDHAEVLAGTLAARSGARGGQLRRHVARRLDGWRTLTAR